MRRVHHRLGVLVVAFAFASTAAAATKAGKHKNNLDLDCDSASYQKSTLTLLSSQKFAAIPGFLRSGHMRQFEGSGISVGPAGQVAVVFDNSHALGILGSARPASSSSGSPLSIGVGELVGERGGSQSGWEGVAWRHDNPGGPATVLALREAVEVPPGAAAVDGGGGGGASNAVDGDFGGDGDESLGWAPPGYSRSAPRANSSEVIVVESEAGADADRVGVDDGEKRGKGGNEGNKKGRKEGKMERKKKRRRDGNPMFAVVDELQLPTIAGEPPKIIRSCPVDFELTAENKGLEDLYYLGDGRAIALCEGNYCEGGSRGREAGNGRLLVLRFDDGAGAADESGGDEQQLEDEDEKKGRRRLHLGLPRLRRGGPVVFVGGERAADAMATARASGGGNDGTKSGGGAKSGGGTKSGGRAKSGGGPPRPVISGAAAPRGSQSPPSPRPLFAARCAWRVESVVDLPRDARFEDYSGLALRSGLAAVLSQVDSSVFVAGFNVETLEFDPVPSDKRYARRVFALPRSNTCQEHSFCTAEGIDLLDDPLVRGVVRVLVATDKAAAGSPWACVHTAEAVHVMSLPKHALPQAPDDDGEGSDDDGEGSDDEGD